MREPGTCTQLASSSCLIATNIYFDHRPCGGSEHFAAELSELNGPFSLAFDMHHNLFFLENRGIYIRKIDMKTKLISTYFTQKVYDEESLFMQKIVINPHNNQLFMLYRTCLKMMNGSRYDSVLVAGTPGAVGSSGDGGAAVNARFGTIAGVAFDSHSNIYISDMMFHNIRVVWRSGKIHTLAGAPYPLDPLGYPIAETVHFSGDGGPADEARLVTLKS